MAYQSKARRPTKELREPIPGNGKKLAPGKFHNVTIIVADRKEDKQAVMVFKDDFENTHIETLFLFSKNEDDLSSKIKQLLAAIANNTNELKSWYDHLLDGDLDILKQLVNSRCSIETFYNKDYINIKTIRSTNEKLSNSNGGDFFQSSKADTSHTKGTTDTERFNQYVSLPESATSFF